MNNSYFIYPLPQQLPGLSMPCTALQPQGGAQSLGVSGLVWTSELLGAWPGLKLFSSSTATRGAAAWMAFWMLCRFHWVLKRASSRVKKPSRVRRTWEQTAVLFSSKPISCTSLRSCFCVSCMHCTSAMDTGQVWWSAQPLGSADLDSHPLIRPGCLITLTRHLHLLGLCYSV